MCLHAPSLSLLSRPPLAPSRSKLHTCKSCGQAGERGSKDGELVPCRRCPQAWHRRCLPSNLPLARYSADGARVWLADFDEEQGGLGQGVLGAGRAFHAAHAGVAHPVLALLIPCQLFHLPTPGKWLDGVETSLLYCKRHPMDSKLGQAKFVRRLRKQAGQGGQVSWGSTNGWRSAVWYRASMLRRVPGRLKAHSVGVQVLTPLCLLFLSFWFLRCTRSHTC